LQAYSDSGRVGFYCRVLSAGELQKGQSVSWLTRNKDSNKDKKYPKITIQKLFLAKHKLTTDKDWRVLEKAVEHPALSKAWQNQLMHLLDKRNRQ
jgi:MOSC domain-containing protein YiiM